ncbi:hypothetical protein BJ741DRAFT_700970, partial [Chytriomyces cf. hyalinus JEL632]
NTLFNRLFSLTWNFVWRHQYPSTSRLTKQANIISVHEELPGPPTMAQLAELDAAVQRKEQDLHKAVGLEAKPHASGCTGSKVEEGADLGASGNADCSAVCRPGSCYLSTCCEGTKTLDALWHSTWQGATKHANDGAVGYAVAYTGDHVGCWGMPTNAQLADFDKANKVEMDGLQKKSTRETNQGNMEDNSPQAKLLAISKCINKLFPHASGHAVGYCHVSAPQEAAAVVAEAGAVYSAEVADTPKEAPAMAENQVADGGASTDGSYVYVRKEDVPAKFARTL